MRCDTTDPSLLESVRDPENDQAWRQFEASYRNPIANYCRSCGLTSDQAEEIVQECFIKCFRYLSAFSYDHSAGRFRSWLNLLVNQQIAQSFRHTIKEVRAKQNYAELIREFTQGHWDEAHEPPGYEFELVTMAVQKTKQEVSPKHWQVFESYVLNKVDATQVARQFGIRNITVRVISFRVKKNLLRCWKNLQKGPL